MSEIEKWNDYTCSYIFGNSQWGFEVRARSMAEAEARVIAIRRSAIVDGELIAKIPAGVGLGWGVRFAVWLRNLVVSR